MQFIRRANVWERSRTALLAGLIFWVIMTSVFSAFFLSEKPQLGPRDFLVVAGVCLAGAMLFGAAMALFFQPLMAPPGPESDDGEEGLGCPAKLIPPSRVFGARVVADSREKADPATTARRLCSHLNGR